MSAPAEFVVATSHDLEARFILIECRDPLIRKRVAAALPGLLRGSALSGLRAALRHIRDDRIPQGMSPALYAEHVLREVFAEEP